MPEFEVMWAPLSRKWQVWQRQLDQSGCAVETLLGEFSSEGRANHELAVLRGDVPVGTQYEPPRGRRWFSLPGVGRSKSSSGDPKKPGDEQEAPAEISPLVLREAQVERTVRTEDAPSTGASSTVTEWQTSLIQCLEQIREHTERHEVESIRRILEEALLVVPGAQDREQAA